LPRGTWTFDGVNWTYQANSDNAVLKFPFSLDGSAPTNVTVEIDWDKYKPTIAVTDGASVRYEVPTGLRIRTYTDDQKSGYIDIYTDWYKSDCGTTLLEPSKVAIKGEFGYQGAIGVQFEANIKKTKEGSSNLVATNNTGGRNNNIAIKSDGYVKVNVGKDSGKVTWENAFYGSETRGSNCVLTDLKITKGDLKFGATFTISGKTDKFELIFSFKDVNPSVPSVYLDGKVKVNGAIVVLFEGTLEPTGENLILTFADGSISLAEFIKMYLGDIRLDLGTLPLPSL
jgi:hypothetical protein